MKYWRKDNEAGATTYGHGAVPPQGAEELSEAEFWAALAAATTVQRSRSTAGA